MWSHARRLSLSLWHRFRRSARKLTRWLRWMCSKPSRQLQAPVPPTRVSVQRSPLRRPPIRLLEIPEFETGSPRSTPLCSPHLAPPWLLSPSLRCPAMRGHLPGTTNVSAPCFRLLPRGPDPGMDSLPAVPSFPPRGSRARSSIFRQQVFSLSAALFSMSPRRLLWNPALLLTNWPPPAPFLQKYGQYWAAFGRPKTTLQETSKCISNFAGAF